MAAPTRPPSDAVDAREACEPDTAIATKPRKKTSKRTASFTYTFPTPGATFQCQLDGGRWVACATTGKTYQRLARGTHKFKVRAKDADGTVDPTPASYSWRVT